MTTISRTSVAGRIKVFFDIPSVRPQTRYHGPDNWGLYDFGDLFRTLGTITSATALYEEPAPDGLLVRAARVDVMRIAFGSPLEVVIAAGAGAPTLLALLRFVRDWDSVRRTSRARSRYEEAFYERLSQAVRDEALTPEILQALRTSTSRKAHFDEPETFILDDEEVELREARPSFVSAVEYLAGVLGDVELEGDT